MSHMFQVSLAPDFPLSDVSEIGCRLAASKGVHPGFTPASVGALDLGALFYAQHQGWSLVVLPDRNLVSRMARIAREGAVAKRDKPTQFACDLMAFCQAMDIQLEPTIAFHELAACDGNRAAQQELGWFRAADHGNGARPWVELAMGRLEKVELGSPEEPELADLAFPLKRWHRNYIVCLKIAALALELRTPLDRALELLRWMYEDFQIAGPAAIFALFYMAPANAHRSLMRRLRASNRDEAIAGIKNAAWDVTHLSDFVQRVGQADTERRRYFFATADESLSAVTPVLFSSLESSAGTRSLADFLQTVWPEQHALELTKALRRYVETKGDWNRPTPRFGSGTVPRAIIEGEDFVRAWAP